MKEAVLDRYTAAAKAASGNAPASCCGGGGCAPAETLDERAKDFISRDLYGAELEDVPLAARLASLGCGNPTALAQLHAGETVLDLGSGGGIDVLLSAKRVGPTGFAYGLDMTDDMLALAERNKVEAGVENVAFLKGEIEEIPLPDASVDVIISNCVINLSADKDRVLRDAFRVLKPGGRLAVSDIVIDGEIPEAIAGDLLAWSGCIAGALPVDDYKAKLTAAGFQDVTIEATRKHTVADAVASGYEKLASCGSDVQAAFDGKFWSAFIRATRP